MKDADGEKAGEDDPVQLLEQLGVGAPVEDQASVRVHERDAKCVAYMASVRVLFSSLGVKL